MNKCEPRTLYSPKLSFKTNGKITDGQFNTNTNEGNS